MKTISGKALVKVLEKNGWRVDRIHGSHYILKKEGIARALAVPVHRNRPLKVGLVKAILRDAGLTESEL